MVKDNKHRQTSPEITFRARELRKDMTPAEKMLWARLRNRQLSDLKFRRQHPIGPFVADFYCARHSLVVEIDGEIDGTQTDYD